MKQPCGFPGYIHQAAHGCFLLSKNYNKTKSIYPFSTSSQTLPDKVLSDAISKEKENRIQIGRKRKRTLKTQ